MLRRGESWSARFTKPPAIGPPVQVADEQGAVDVVEDRLRVDRVGARGGADHAAHPLQPLGERHLVVEVALPVEVLDEGGGALDHGAAHTGRLARVAQRPESQVEALVLERVGQLVSERVVELIASLDQAGHDDDPVAAVVERAADPVEAALGVGAEAELGRQQSGELVEVDAGALQAAGCAAGAAGLRSARLRSRRASLRPRPPGAARPSGSRAAAAGTRARGSARPAPPPAEQRPQPGLDPGVRAAQERQRRTGALMLAAVGRGEHERDRRSPRAPARPGRSGAAVAPFAAAASQVAHVADLLPSRARLAPRPPLGRLGAGRGELGAHDRVPGPVGEQPALRQDQPRRRRHLVAGLRPAGRERPLDRAGDRLRAAAEARQRPLVGASPWRRQPRR